MAYIGNPPAERYSAVSYQDLTGGTGTSFTLDYAVGSANEIEVFVNNVRQEPSVAYTVAGTALTMTGTIASTDDFYVVFQGKAQQTVTHPSGNNLEAVNGTFTGNVDINGNELILDADADTKLYASTDDVVKMNIAGSEVFRFDSDGLKFNGDTASANALDDYEEGSWTPTFKASTTNPTVSSYTNQQGRYIKIGEQVTVFFDFSGAITNIGSGISQIGDLPFAPDNTGGYSAVQFRDSSALNTTAYVTGWVYSVDSRIYIESSNGNSIANPAFRVITGRLTGFATYRTSS